MSQETEPLPCEEIIASKLGMEATLEVHDPGVICCNCEQAVPLEEAMRGPDDNLRCGTCHHEDVLTCEHCETEVMREDASEVEPRGRDSQWWCSHCVTSHTERCDCCSNLIPDDEAIEYGRANLCQGCYEDSYFTCDGCERVLHNDRYSEDGYCTRCNEPDEDDPDEDGLLDHDSDMASSLGPYGESGEGLYFGVELEVESRGGHRCSDVGSCIEALGADFAVAKEDGSLANGKGFEIVTAPATVAVHRQRWKDLLANPPDGLKSWGGYQCGMHVHASRAPISQLTIGKILVFVNSPENRSFIVAVAGRTEACYAALYPKKVSDARRPNYRREGINLANDETIEFRIFRSILKAPGFFKNLEFVEAVIRFCRQAGLRELTVPRFGRFVAEARKQYPALSGWMFEKGYAQRPQVRGKRRLPCA